MVDSEYPHPSASSIAAQVQRRKGIWRVSLVCNFAIAAYLFTLAGRKNGGADVQKPPKLNGKQKLESLPQEQSDPFESVTNTPSPPQKELIYEDQQLKCMLEEKPKSEPRNPEQKKRMDEDRLILERFTGSMPNPRT